MLFTLGWLNRFLLNAALAPVVEVLRLELAGIDPEQRGRASLAERGEVTFTWNLMPSARVTVIVSRRAWVMSGAKSTVLRDRRLLLGRQVEDEALRNHRRRLPQEQELRRRVVEDRRRLVLCRRGSARTRSRLPSDERDLFQEGPGRVLGRGPRSSGSRSGRRPRPRRARPRRGRRRGRRLAVLAARLLQDDGLAVAHGDELRAGGRARAAGARPRPPRPPRARRALGGAGGDRRGRGSCRRARSGRRRSRPRPRRRTSRRPSRRGRPTGSTRSVRLPSVVAVRRKASDAVGAPSEAATTRSRRPGARSCSSSSPAARALALLAKLDQLLALGVDHDLALGEGREGHEVGVGPLQQRDAERAPVGAGVERLDPHGLADLAERAVEAQGGELAGAEVVQQLLVVAGLQTGRGRCAGRSSASSLVWRNGAGATPGAAGIGFMPEGAEDGGDGLAARGPVPGRRRGRACASRLPRARERPFARVGGEEAGALRPRGP